jgi:putative membrane protein
MRMRMRTSRHNDAPRHVVLARWASAIVVSSALVAPGASSHAAQRSQDPPRQSPSAPATQPQEFKPGAREAGQFSAADREFLQQAASSGHAEVELAKLAQQKAQGQACKDLARTLEQDHSKANSELQQIASRKNVTLDSKPSPEDEQLKEKLESLAGPAFDRAYAEAMVKNHQRSIQSFQRATASKDPDVSAFAEKTLPTLKKHLEQAKAAAPARSSN